MGRFFVPGKAEAAGYGDSMRGLWRRPRRWWLDDGESFVGCLCVRAWVLSLRAHARPVLSAGNCVRACGLIRHFRLIGGVIVRALETSGCSRTNNGIRDSVVIGICAPYVWVQVKGLDKLRPSLRSDKTLLAGVCWR